MRAVVKLILIILVIFGLSCYYRLFDFRYGIVRDISESTVIDNLTVENIYYLKTGEDNYIAIFENKNTRYLGKGTQKELESVINGMSLIGTNSHELSIAWLIVGGIAIFFIILFDLGKKKEEK